jgi:hypothetical protein
MTAVARRVRQRRVVGRGEGILMLLLLLSTVNRSAVPLVTILVKVVIVVLVVVRLRCIAISVVPAVVASMNTVVTPNLVLPLLVHSLNLAQQELEGFVVQVAVLPPRSPSESQRRPKAHHLLKE